MNNIKEINSSEILDDICKIMNAKSTFDKFKRIFYIYTIMNSKEENNEIDEHNIHKQIININNPNNNINITKNNLLIIILINIKI